MGKTRRRNYLGETIRDGDHAKRCPSLNCPRCVNGRAKKQWRRWLRRTVRFDD
jgi:hypothetical protein